MNAPSPDAPFFTILEAEASPLVCAAVHAGHDLRPEVAARIALSEEERLREEDPYTDRFAPADANRILVHRSRFEVDLNRSPARAVYRTPEDAWGLRLWRNPPPDDLVARSRGEHDRFYREAEALLRRVAARHGGFVVLDLHSYNHRRGGPDAPPADPEANPAVNLGTATLPPRWRGVVDALATGLRNRPLPGRPADVR